MPGGFPDAILPIIAGVDGDQFQTYKNAPFGYPPGTQMVFADGRKFRLVAVPQATVARGKLYQGRANTAGLNGQTTGSAASVGDATITLTLGATLAADNQMQYGYIVIESGTGAGTCYQIASHPAATSGNPCVFTLNAASRVQVAIANTDVYSIIASPYSFILLAPASATEAIIGVGVSAITTSQYGWLQTAGPCPVLTDGTVVLGNLAIRSASVAGAMVPSAVDTGDSIGRIMRVAGNTAYSLTLLGIDH